MPHRDLFVVAHSRRKSLDHVVLWTSRSVFSLYELVFVSADDVENSPVHRQIRVLGEATDPSAIPYRDHMTLLDVMIATKGLTKYAAGNRAEIVRRDPDGKTTSIPVKLSDLIKDGDISQNVEMQPGDTLIIPQSWF